MFLTRDLAVRTIGCSTRSCCGILHPLELRENRLPRKTSSGIGRRVKASSPSAACLRSGARSCSPRSGQDGEAYRRSQHHGYPNKPGDTRHVPRAVARDATSGIVREEVDDFAIVGEVPTAAGVIADLGVDDAYVVGRDRRRAVPGPPQALRRVPSPPGHEPKIRQRQDLALLITPRIDPPYPKDGQEAADLRRCAEPGSEQGHPGRRPGDHARPFPAEGSHPVTRPLGDGAT